MIGGMRMGGDEAWMRGMQSRSLVEEEVQGEGEGDEPGKSRDDRMDDLLVKPPPRKKGVIGWVKGRLGIAA